MALDFPTSPALNQTYTFGSYTWRWDGTSWVGAVPIVNATINNTTIGAVTPSTGAFTTLSASSDATISGNIFLGTNSNEILNLSTGNLFIASGTTFSGAGWTARSATPNIISAAGAVSIFIDSGKTIGSVYSPTLIASFTSTGLGIGTASPAGKLQVTGSSASFILNTTGTEFYNTNAGTVKIYASNAAGALALSAGGRDAGDLFINSTGNVGIGVTPSAWSGFVALQIGANSNLWSSTSGGSTSYYSNNLYYNGTNRIYKTSGFATEYQLGSDGQHRWFNAPTGTAGNAITFTQAMTLDASSRLGVNTTDASTGGGQMVISQAQENGLVVNASTSSYSSTLYLRDVVGSNSARIRFMSSNGLNFIDNNDIVKARIDSSGNLLVGKTADVLANAGCLLDNRGSFTFTRDGATVGYINRLTSNGELLSFLIGTTQVGSISYNGSLTLYNQTSDYRLKDITGPLTDSGAFIDALKPKVGTWKSSGNKFVGFIAHEFAEVSPTSVTGEKDDVDSDGKPVYQGMQAGTPEVIANLVAELQSLRQRVAALENS